MTSDIDKTQQQKQQIQDELKSASVSRRGFIDRIKTLGFGFGAAIGLGLDGGKHATLPILGESDVHQSGVKYDH
jgi:hypothetical protein